MRRWPWIVFALGFVLCLLSWWSQPEAALAASGPVRPPMITHPATDGSNGWERVVDAPYGVAFFPARPYRCPAWRRRWITADNVSVAVVVWTCQESNDAAVALWELMFLSGGSGVTSSYTPLARDPNAWTRSIPAGPSTDGLRETAVLLARSNYVMVVVAKSPASSGIATASLASRVLLQEAALLTGPDHHFSAPPLVNNAVNALLAALITVYLVIFLPIRYLRNPLRKQRYEVRRADANWIDVTAKANRLKWSLRFRAIARLVFLISLASVAVTRNIGVTAAVYLVLGGLFGWIRPVGRFLRDWKPRRVRGVNLRHNRNSWLELVFAMLSLACVLALLIILLVDLGLYGFGLAHSPLVVGGLLDPRYLNAIPAWQEFALTMLIAIPVNDLLQVTSIAAILLLAAAAVLRRFGRRFALADAVIAQQADSRRPILYLRNFSDDVLKMPSSALARTSLTERFSVARLQPFEEILVRHLRRAGPVIALSHPSTRLPALGAAKVVRSNESWQAQIREWADVASLVVVAVTPREVSVGLRWETEFLAQDAPQASVMLVVSPYKQRQVEVRWRKFCSEALKLPRFSGLVHYAEHNSGAHFMVNSGSGWRVWGAHKRSEFTYAVAFTEALETLENEQHAMRRRLRKDRQHRFLIWSYQRRGNPPEPGAGSCSKTVAHRDRGTLLLRWRGRARRDRLIEPF